MTAVFSYLRVRQNSGQDRVLRRATSATVRCDAAATVVVLSLNASLSHLFNAVAFHPGQRKQITEPAPNEVTLATYASFASSNTFNRSVADSNSRID